MGMEGSFEGPSYPRLGLQMGPSKGVGADSRGEEGKREEQEREEVRANSPGGGWGGGGDRWPPESKDVCPSLC